MWRQKFAAAKEEKSKGPSKGQPNKQFANIALSE